MMLIKECIFYVQHSLYEACLKIIKRVKYMSKPIKFKFIMNVFASITLY